MCEIGTEVTLVMDLINIGTKCTSMFWIRNLLSFEFRNLKAQKKSANWSIDLCTMNVNRVSRFFSHFFKANYLRKIIPKSEFRSL